MKTSRRHLLLVLAAFGLLWLPVLWFRPAGKAKAASADHLVILTPHTETIRTEFATAFRQHYRQQHGRDLEIDWRAPGGTSDITRLIADQYQAAFRQIWCQNGAQAWTPEVAAAFANAKLPKEAPALARQARAAFLASDASIGVDLFFGGGQYDHDKQAKAGYAVASRLLQRHPEWFAPEIIPQTFSGETFYDPQGRYFGVCVSTFGLCYNTDRLRELPDSTPPRTWADLGHPRFQAKIALADPTKSGSVNRCFELMLQEAMSTTPDPEAGWSLGWSRLRRLGGNAFYITDSASKVPRDVGMGAVAAGLCIDFYGRSEAEYLAQANPKAGQRMVYATPEGGSSVSSDPIQLLRGAPNREVAEEFIEFVLSPEGQRLWNYRSGTTGGPQQYALRRLPIRRDLYSATDRQHMSDPDANPYAEVGTFVYRPERTGPYFDLIRSLFRCSILDPLPELHAAWNAILANGGPEQNPEAMAALTALPFPYAKAGEAARAINPRNPDNTPFSITRQQREWTEFFRRQYLQAKTLAEQHPAHP